MGFKEVKANAVGLVMLQRSGELYWWDVEYRNARIPSLPHRLAPQRKDFTEEVLRKWAMRGELFTYVRN